MAKIIGNTTATPTPASDWLQTDENKADYIKNKPKIGKPVYTQAEEPTDAPIGALWVDTDAASPGSSIDVDSTLTQEGQAADAKAVGDALSLKVNTSELATVATTGDYNDLENKPQELSDEELFVWLNDANVITPASNSAGELYVTNNNEIYVL
jgi:hypothetical protein